MMKKLSTGQDSTLGHWLAIAESLFGSDSEPVEHVQWEISRAELGANEHVTVPEHRYLYMLRTMTDNYPDTHISIADFVNKHCNPNIQT